MTETSANTGHAKLVGQQFGARAEAYLTSAVHAQGADLGALADLARGRGGARVLDLGCGGGHVSFAVAPEVAEVVAYDLSPEMLQVVAAAAGARGLKNLVTAEGRAERLPFADASFDMVMSRYSAHHWQDAQAGLVEAARVLKPGGSFGLVDSISPGTPLLDTFLQALEILRDPSHVRSYARAEWEAMIARAGFVCRRSQHFRIRLDFATWIARMATPPVQADAIRALQRAVSAEVTGYYDIAEDGSFSLDVALFEAVKPA